MIKSAGSTSVGSKRSRSEGAKRYGEVRAKSINEIFMKQGVKALKVYQLLFELAMKIFHVRKEFFVEEK